MNLGSHAAIIADLGRDYTVNAVPNGYSYAHHTGTIVGQYKGYALTPNIPVGDAGNLGYGIAGRQTPALLGRATGGNPFKIYNGETHNGVEGIDLLLLGYSVKSLAQFIGIQYTITQQDIDNYGDQATMTGSVRRPGTGGDGIIFEFFVDYFNPKYVDSNNTGTDASLTAEDGAYNWQGQVVAGTVITWLVDYRTTNIDDLVLLNGQINLVPEPETYALIFGGLALGFAMLRRRFKA